jgi:hypothetical protein
MEVDRCPADPDETVEAYKGKLPEEQNAVFEHHFLGCPWRSKRLQFTDDFITAVRRPATRLWSPKCGRRRLDGAYAVPEKCTLSLDFLASQSGQQYAVLHLPLLAV